MKEIPSKARILKPEAVPNLLTNIEKRKSKHILSRAPMPLSISVKVESMAEASFKRNSTDSIMDMPMPDIKIDLDSPGHDSVSNADFFDLRYLVFRTSPKEVLITHGLHAKTDLVPDFYNKNMPIINL